MREGPQAVARMLAKRLAPLFLLLALLALVGDPRGGGVQAGLLAAAGVTFYLVVFGVARATHAFPPAVLRAVAVWGVALAAGAGVFAAIGHVFGFIVVDIARTPASVGGALMHIAAFLTVGAVAALVMQCLAARTTPLDDAP